MNNLFDIKTSVNKCQPGGGQYLNNLLIIVDT